MPFKFNVRALREMPRGIGSKPGARRGVERKSGHGLGRSHIAPERSPSSSTVIQQSGWANLPRELLLDIIQRVEASQNSWPARRDVVACAAVCKSWRETIKEVVRTPEQCGLLTFPISLKQPGPRDSPIQCFIKRERATSTYRLYLGLTPDDFSRAGINYNGKLRSNFLGTKFVIYDNQPLHDPAIQTNHWSHQKIYKKMISPRASAGNCSMATISYELNVLRTRGPRRMRCTINSIPISAIQEGGTAPTPATFGNCFDEQVSPLSLVKGKGQPLELSSMRTTEPLESIYGTRDPLILKNKAPRWHEQLQCWCLNFKGRVTVASVKNFQLVAAARPCQNVPAAEQEKVILQFGKIGKDIFTMDYLYPLSAFQAFAICLSSFDTKPACE